MKKFMCVLALPILLLSACATLNEDFDCPAPKGGSCKRMDEIYDMVNGESGVGQKRLAIAADRNPYAMEGHPGAPLRYGEGVMRLWIAPFEDKDGNFHQANQIYSVVREGHWILNPPLATK